MCAKKIVINTELKITSPNIKPVISSIKKQLNGITGTVDIKFKPNITNNFTRLNKQLQDLRTNLRLVENQANSTAYALEKVANVSIKVAGNLNQQNNAVKNYNRNISNTGTAVKASSSAIEDFGRKSALAIKRYAAFTVATAGIIGFGVAAKNAFREAVGFEREFIKISQVTGKSVSQLRDLSGEIDRLATGLGVSSKGLVNTAQVLAQAGLSAKDTKLALESLAKTELSPTFGRIEETTEGAIAAMQQFDIQAKDLDKTLSSLNAVAGAFAVESEDIISVIQKAGGAFKATGGSLNELVALFTSVRQTTRENADQIATGLRTIFTRLERPNTLKFLETLGVKLTDAQGNFIGVYKSIGLLSQALSKIEATDPRLTQIFEELGGYRQISRVVPLIQQFAVAERALGIAQRGENTLTIDAATAQQTLAVQLSKVQEEFKKLFRIIAGDASIRSLISLTLELATSLTQVAKSLQPILPLITAFGAAKLVTTGGSFLKGFTGRNSGGPIPGSGNSDTVPALLTPGEFVINKSAASAIGINNLNNLNGMKKFALGGKVGPIGAAAGGALLVSGVASQFGDLGHSISTAVNSLGVLAIAAASLGYKISDVTKAFTFYSSIIRKGINPADFNEQSQLLTQKSSRYAKPLSFSDAKAIRQKVINDLQSQLPAGLSPHPTAVKAGFKSAISGAQFNILNNNAAIFKEKQSQLIQQRIAQTRLNNISKVGGIAGIGAGILGGFASAEGERRVSNQDRSGVGISALGGALSGGGTGAAIGATFGPLGIAIGGTAGALIGLASAAKGASEQLDRVTSQKQFDDFTESLNRVVSGKSTIQSQSAQLLRGINTVNGGLATLGPGESRNDILSNIKNSTTSLENFVIKLTQESGSLGEFKSKNGGVGAKTLGILSIATNTNVKTLENEIKKNIQLNKNAEQVQQRLNKATFNTANNLEKFVQFANAMKEASNRTDKLSASFNTLENILGGGVGGSKFIGNGSALQVTGNKDLANTSDQLKQLVKDLPSILVDLRGDNPLENKILDSFSERLKNLPDFIKSQLLASAENIQGGETGFLKEIDTNVYELAKKLTDGFNPIFDSIQTASETLKHRVDELDTQLSSLSSNELKLQEGRLKSGSIGFGALEFGAKARGGNVTSTEFNAFQSSQSAIRLGGTRLGGGASASDIGAALVSLQDEITKAEAAKQNAPASDQLKLNKAFHQLVLESAKLTKALDHMATSTEKVDFAQQELNREQDKTRLKQDFAKTFAFGSQEDQIKLNRDIKNAQIAAQRGSVKGFTAEDKQGALHILEQFGETKSNAFGGRSGNQVIRDISTNDLGAQGELAKTLRGTSSEEDKLITNIQDLINSQKDAQDALNHVLEAGNEKLKNNLESQFKEFLSGMDKILKEDRTRDVKLRSISVVNKLNAAKEQENAKNILNTEFGSVGYAKSLQEVLPQIKAFKDINQENQSLLGAYNKFSGSNNSLGILRQDFSVQEKILEKTFDNFNKHFEDLFSPSERTEIGEKFNALKSKFGVSTSDLSYGTNLIVNEAVNKKLKGNNLTAFGGTDDNGVKHTGLKEEIQKTLGSTRSFTEAMNLGTDSLKVLSENLRILKDVDISRLPNIIKDLDNQLDILREEQSQIDNPVGKAMGGRIFSPRGTDTVPAMLTPGEYVVNRNAAQANLGLLEEINSGGGGYFARGGFIGSIAERRQHYLEQRQARVNRRLAERQKLRDIGFNFFGNISSLNEPSKPSIAPFRGTVAERRQYQISQRQARIAKRKAGGFASGGVVGYANGGAVSGGGDSSNGFNESVNKFMTASSQLAEAMNKFPHTISLETTGRIEVILNGAEAFQQMQPAMSSYVDGKIKDAINKLMKGPLQGSGPR